LLAHGRWFSLGTPASSTTKTGCHDIAEILLKVALNHQKSINQINQKTFEIFHFYYYQWVDTSAGGPKGIIHPVVSVLALT
jgi:protein tyrosine phosphatase